MGAIGSKLRSLEGGLIAFRCPGCKQNHQVRPFDGSRGWTFNGDGDKPTFSPSILVTGPSRFCTDEEIDRIMATGQKIDLPNMRCHSFVTDGNIQFLSDCSHELAGQTVPLPDWES